VFGLPDTPGRVEIYDNSHLQGTNAVGAIVVAGVEGFRKKDYRKFNFTLSPAADTPTGGDDYAMMHTMLTRRFARAVKSAEEGETVDWPQLLLIDGGAGQLAAAENALAGLGITDITVVGVAKGEDRNAGRERFFMAGREPFTLPPDDPVMYFIQRLRDEAHRFAIGAHRTRRQGSMGKSPLDTIPGIGGTRKKQLLQHFGSAKAVAQASLADLQKVPGISKALAGQIFGYFNPQRVN
jgi:excinuclease ABC subunit C